MLPSTLAAPSERRQPNEIRAVPKASPMHNTIGNNVPFFCEWDNNPPKKQTMYTMRSMIDRQLYDVIIDMPIKKAYAAWIGGEHIQVALSTLAAEGREFIKTGITPSQWDEMFKEVGEDD